MRAWAGAGQGVAQISRGCGGAGLGTALAILLIKGSQQLQSGVRAPAGPLA